MAASGLLAVYLAFQFYDVFQDSLLLSPTLPLQTKITTVCPYTPAVVRFHSFGYSTFIRRRDSTNSSVTRHSIVHRHREE